ncbi:hypothetical protein KFK09_005743 [Dendrobium nobile]|uniref:DNA/RNA-binding protein Alba-like domain-containing protein n=1 Tax=Dendrobium nobile TaxID=94219 RepID=A0A8T3C005_DENNO|nr:hypothetical protein KFK09_005743 [Dendrobium nobile]
MEGWVGEEETVNLHGKTKSSPERAVGYCGRSLTKNNREKLATEIVLKAMGQAISKTVVIVEILKYRKGLLDCTKILSITDIWEPIEEGLVPLEMTRHVSMISISLSTRMLSRNSPGSQSNKNISSLSITISTSHRESHQLNSVMIHLVKDVVEVEVEEEEEEEEGAGAGAGARADMEDMKGMEGMEDIQTTKDIQESKDIQTTKDIQATKDMQTIKKMVNGILVGVVAVGVIEEVGDITMVDMNEAEEEVVGEASDAEEVGWVAVGGEISSSSKGALIGLSCSCEICMPCPSTGLSSKEGWLCFQFNANIRSPVCCLLFSMV